MKKTIPYKIDENDKRHINEWLEDMKVYAKETNIDLTNFPILIYHIQKVRVIENNIDIRRLVTEQITKQTLWL